MSRRPLLRTGMLLLAAAATFAPTAANGADDDDLQQTIDPNQQQGTGQVVLDRGHVDFGPTLNTGEWIIQAHDDTSSPSFWRHLEDVVMKVGDAGILDVPDSAAYDFLGQEPGTAVWVVPQVQATDVVWTGWNTQEPTVLDRLDRGTTLTVHGVEGPGDVIVYLQSGNFADPQSLWSTLQPFPQQTWIEVNTHTHANWVFTEPGIYLVDIQFDAELNTAEAVSARDTLRFAVGDGTAAEQAFGMTAASGAEPSPSAEPDPDPDAAAPGSSGDGAALGTVVWIVVAVVVVVLVGAIATVVLASRNARRRALAARATRGPAR